MISISNAEVPTNITCGSCTPWLRITVLSQAHFEILDDRRKQVNFCAWSRLCVVVYQNLAGAVLATLNGITSKESLRVGSRPVASPRGNTEVLPVCISPFPFSNFRRHFDRFKFYENPCPRVHPLVLEPVVSTSTSTAVAQCSSSSSRSSRSSGIISTGAA